MKQLIECVPNISEGRNESVIKQIADVIEKAEGVKLLDVDPGYTTNRTVITFVGEPQAVVNAAFLLIKKASELIDMKVHHGDHPRFGATDVCPLIPVSNITMEETIEYALLLGERVGKELGIPVYLYENAAREEKRRNLAACRSGEYEGLKDKIESLDWKPCFGPTIWNEHIASSGATAISARDFLIAVNYNLNTTSTRRANAIAFDVREKGRPKREGNKPNGKPLKDENGNPIMIPGTLKGTKAIGWYIEEYGIAQVSMNITNISQTPLHICFEEVCKKAGERGIRVTGVEIVGLVPKKALIQAADYYLKKQQRSLGIDEKEKIKIAIKSMGLDDLKPFVAEEKIIEYLIEDKTQKKLIDLSALDLCNETASESPAPGGGSISAYVGSLGAALATMVANLSSHKAGWDERWEEFSIIAQKGQKIKDELLFLVDEDTNAFNRIMDAFSLPKKTEQEKENRKDAIQKATKYAIEIPFKTLEKSFEVFSICIEMIEKGNPNSITDAAVGILCAKAACYGAFMNVKINASSLDDKTFVNDILIKGEKIIEKAEEIEREYTHKVLNQI
ncbi:MAG: glutamate formimidoyltransferase [Bacteroidales bacterium]|jgi:glutamate formiminotransferase/formiminotetrahydrofolate cyclodeaminase|nr:glutamate formimidoyltransferase [Bacteroidales bacterium]